MGMKLAVQTVFNALDKMTGPMNSMGKGVDRFSRNANRAGLDVGATWGKLRNIMRTVAVAVTTGLAAKAINDFAEKGDEVARVARTLGLSAEALQELEYAAKMADLSSEDLAGAFKKMNNSMGQLRTGSGALYKYLKATNPQLALQLKHTKDSDTAFTMLMGAIAAEGDVAKRATLTQAAFGKGGQVLIEMAKGLNDMRKEARASGGIISDRDVEAGKQFNTTMKKVGVTLTGFKNNILGRAVAALGPWLDKLDAWMLKNKDIIGQRIDNAINWIVTAAKDAYDIFNKWSPVIWAVAGGVVAFNVAMRAAAIISVVSKAIAIASAIWTMFSAGASFATVAQWAFNVAVAANPIMLIAMAVAALILIIVLLAKNWDKVTAAFKAAGAWIANTFRTIRDWIYKALDNPLIRAAALIFAPFITIPILIAKHWREIIDTIKSAIDWIAMAGGKVGKFFGLGGGAAPGAGGTPVSPNTGIIASNVSTTRRSLLDVNFNNAPAGTTMKQTGASPDITVGMFNTLRGS
jgi:hypothetical protein